MTASAKTDFTTPETASPVKDSTDQLQAMVRACLDADRDGYARGYRAGLAEAAKPAWTLGFDQRNRLDEILNDAEAVLDLAWFYAKECYGNLPEIDDNTLCGSLFLVQRKLEKARAILDSKPDDEKPAEATTEA